MRILFTFVGGNGHFEPLVPIARAAAAAGYTVAFAGGYRMIPAMEATGFTVFPTGKPASGAPPERMPLQKVDFEKDARDLRDGFADRGARNRAADLLRIAGEWKPDVMVCDDVDFGSMIAAERLGIPYASVVVIVAGSLLRHEVIAEPLSRVREENNLPPDPELQMLSRYLVLSPAPPSFRDPNYPLPTTAHSIRPAVLGDSAEKLPLGWPSYLPGNPTVYFTLGTIFNLESGDLFQRVLAGLRELPVNVVATVGRDINPEELGTQPPNIRIARFIPQASILSRCDLAVSHGGSGTVIGALAYGVPMVLIPMGADQPQNAERCEALGVAKVLDAVDATPDMIRDAVAEVLKKDSSYRQAAERVRDEIATLPGADYALTLLERLALEKAPILST